MVNAFITKTNQIITHEHGVVMKKMLCDILFIFSISQKSGHCMCCLGSLVSSPNEWKLGCCRCFHL